ncbi:MAG TPA: Fe-Mn family superoxide dismutase, partial [Candidatus Saccharimonadales bacterium]|nr:Fe-Mn family superoxide dismutase [Candidatus Saccharimonadales bacterium]
MKGYTRRKALIDITAGGAGLALTTLSASRLVNAKPVEIQTAETIQTPRAFRGQRQPKPLPFDPSKLRGLSEKLIRSHWENNYGGAVKALNAVEQRLDSTLKEKDLPAYMYGDLKREELLRTGSVVLHEQYFANLGGDGKAAGKALDLLKQWFGSYEQWEAEFKKTANALSGGSGWVILAYNLHNSEVH